MRKPISLFAFLALTTVALLLPAQPAVANPPAPAHTTVKLDGGKPMKLGGTVGLGNNVRCDNSAPSVSASALADELRRVTSDKQADMTAEMAKIVKERERLEKLGLDVAKEREGLRKEIAELQSLLKRADNMGGRRQQLAALEAEIKTTSSRLDTVKKELKQATTVQLNDANRTQLEQVAKAMKGMKPDTAAAMLNQLERPVVAELLRRMKPAQAGAIMEKLKPEVAADMANAMAGLPPSRGEVKQ